MQTANSPSVQVLHELLDRCAAERRGDTRFAYFAALQATLADGVLVPVYCRDISRTGVGLLSRTPLHDCELCIRLPDSFGGVSVQAAVRWCQPGGHDWFAAGAEFVEVSLRDRVQLWLAGQVESLRERLAPRYPFFRPAWIRFGSRAARPVPGFARDISVSGLGLIHDTTARSESAFVTIEDEAGSFEFRIRRAWCRRCSPERFSSGWTFAPATRLMEDLVR